MIGEKEIIRAIASIVKSKFNGIEVYDRATKEDLKRPVSLSRL